jgi:ABC-2 type transport system permease protein
MKGALLRIGAMVRKEMRQLLRDPRTRMMIFVAPLVQLVMFGYAVNTDIRNTKTVVVDLDRTAASRALVDAFRSSGYFQVVKSAARSSDLVWALDKGDAIVGIEIPRGFARDLVRGRAVVQIVVDGSNSSIATMAQGYAARIVQRLAAEGDLPPGSGQGVELRLRAWYNPNLESRVYNIPAVIGVLVLMMSLLLTALAVVRERELGTLDQLLVSPLSPAELVAAKTLPVAFIGLVDLLLITAVAVFWFQVPLQGSVLTLLPAALLYILAGLSFGLLISSISKTQQEAFMAIFLFLLPAIILSGFFYPIRSMPLPFQWLTVLNPVRHFLEIVRAVFLKGEGVGGLWVQYLAIALLALVAIGAAIWRLPRSVAGG